MILRWIISTVLTDWWWMWGHVNNMNVNVCFTFYSGGRSACAGKMRSYIILFYYISLHGQQLSLSELCSTCADWSVKGGRWGRGPSRSSISWRHSSPQADVTCGPVASQQPEHWRHIQQRSSRLLVDVEELTPELDILDFGLPYAHPFFLFILLWIKVLVLKRLNALDYSLNLLLLRYFSQLFTGHRGLV